VLIALVVLAMFAAVVLWLIVRTARLPKKPEHERQPERFRDPAITAYKSPPGPGF
jgi:hypothetical protein